MHREPEQPFLLLVDDSPFRRVGLAAVLREWADEEGLAIEVAGSPADAAERANVFHSQLVVLSIGGSSLMEEEPRNRLRALRGLALKAPIVVIADLEDSSGIVAAFRLGAAAYLPTSMDPHMVFPALTYVRSGGFVFPPSALLSRPDDRIGGSDLERADERQTVAPRELAPPSAAAPTPAGRERRAAKLPTDDPDGSDNGAAAIARVQTYLRGAGAAFAAAEAVAAAAPPAEHAGAQPLTERQAEVLEHLGQGQSNKMIARELGMTEATVKVHVRQIIRKLGVANRTQAAVRALALGAPSSERRSAAVSVRVRARGLSGIA